jgi:dTDP-4-amino-4,6-dideoxygalactose transaminase
MKNFGFVGEDNVGYVGTNGKMSEVSAAMGLTSLEVIPDIIAANRRNYQRYRQGLDGLDGLRLFAFDENEQRNYQYVVVEVDEEATGLNRDELIAVLRAENVLARRYFFPGCHRMEPYRSYFPHAGLLLPNTQRVASRVLCLPTGTAVSPEQVDEIVRLIRLAVANAPEVRRCLAENDQRSEKTARLREGSV